MTIIQKSLLITFALIIALTAAGFFMLGSFLGGVATDKTEENGTQKGRTHKDATYNINGRDIVLANGLSELETAPGSASKIITRYFGNEAWYDFNGDGREDITFLLTQDTGGSGIFFYIVAALDSESGFTGSRAYFLGDRIAPQTTEMGERGMVIVNYADRNEGESFSTPPSVGKSVWLLFDSETMRFYEIDQPEDTVVVPPPPAPKPVVGGNCTSDTECPSPHYRCEAIQGVGTVSPNGGPSTYTIIKGACKLKEGGRCSSVTDCTAGLLCYAGTCTAPIGRECDGADDLTCPSDFECVQGCGPPVARQDDPPPPYFCQLKGYERICPICLSEGTRIDTPSGAVPVEELARGMIVWTMNEFGKRESRAIVDIAKTLVPMSHEIVHLILDDGREVFVSSGHPVGDGRAVGDLSTGDLLDGGRIVRAKKVPYQQAFTYDILPGGNTGLYWAEGILLESTLFKKPDQHE